jgi:hypothetical protein
VHPSNLLLGVQVIVVNRAIACRFCGALLATIGFLSTLFAQTAANLASLYRNGRIRVAASVHCSSPQPKKLLIQRFLRTLQLSEFVVLAVGMRKP